MKKMHSVSVRVHVLLLLMGILIAATLITSASVTNSRQVDDFLKTKTSQASATIAAYVDADLVSRLTETVLTDEYQALRSEAGEAGDEARIEKHLEEKGLLADVMKLQKTLSSHRDLQGAKYVYLISVQKDSGVSYDPLAKEDPDITLPAEKRQIGGLGIFMVKKSMDEVRYRRENGQNVFTMIKKW